VPFAGIEPTHPDYKTGPLPLRIKGHGGDGGNRAPDSLRMKEVLYQLSYITLVRGKGIEPLTKRWQRLILPLN
jgi:hypothetical protein